MMTNLFSIFDPCTPNFMSSNLSSILLVLTLFPASMFIITSRTSLIYKKLSEYIKQEFSPLVVKSPFTVSMYISIFTLILVNNTLGLFPFIFTATSHLTFSLSLALPLWLSLMLYGWMFNTTNLLIHLIPQGTPTILIPFMVLIETVSNLIRPGTLAIRLSANMVAGHLLITLLSSANTFTPYSGMLLLVSAQIALTLLEIAVAMIQAYVFSILITLYTNEIT